MIDLTDRIPKFKAYPPVPNWYSSNATAVIDPHLFLYASKNVVIVLDLTTLNYFNSFAVSSERDKVTAIAAYDTFCFTAGTDRIVKSWNILLGSFIAKQYEHEEDITSLKLIRGGSVLISGDKSGQIFISEPFGERKASSRKVKSEINCIATLNHDRTDHIAIGYNNGLIFVEKIEEDLSLTTLFQLGGDNDPIQSLDWQHLKNDSKAWPLLASSRKNRKNVSVWILPSQNQLCNIKLLPPPVQSTETQKSSVNIQVAWSPLHEKKLYLTSYIGNILCYNISGNPKLSNKERLHGHTRNVFTINWCNEGRNCITTSLDKQLIKWDMTTTSAVQILKTQGMFPYALEACDWNQGQIAIGMGDNSIKLWNFSSEGTVMKSKKRHDFFDATVIWKGLQGKIEKIKWHPLKEGLLAYSTDYGRVGFYDVLNMKCYQFKIFHGDQKASSIDWGLDMSGVLESPEMVDVVVSCGRDGMVLVFDSGDLNAEPIILNDLLNNKNPVWSETLKSKGSNRSVLKVDKDRKFIAFGHTDGTVEVYVLSTLKLAFVSNCQRQNIRALDWKNVGDKIYLASGSNQGDIAIHNLSDIDVSALPDAVIPHPEAFKLLKGHERGVSNIRWSSHNDKLLLASGGDDSLVVVWDVMHEKNISVFNKHRNNVLSVCWSPLSPNTVFSSSEDRFIYMWDMEDFAYTEAVKSKKSLRDEEYAITNSFVAKKRRADEPISTSGSSKSSGKKKSKKSDTEKGADDIPMEASFLSVAKKAEDLTFELEKKQFCLILADRVLGGKVRTEVEEMKKTLLSETELSNNMVAKYINIFPTQEQMGSEKPRPKINELFFGDKNDVRQLIEIESTSLNEKETNGSSKSGFSLQNDVKDNLDLKLAMDVMQSQYSLINEKRFDNNINSCLSDWIILALSPMVGKESWIELMLKQAKKLETLKQHHLSSICYIACGHIYDAINVYKNNKMYREAIALAKLRLPDKDPIVGQLFREWADVLESGNLDYLTASCYLLSNTDGGISNAMNALARSSKEDGFFFAACLARVVKDGTQDARVDLWLKKMRDRISTKKDKHVKFQLNAVDKEDTKMKDTEEEVNKTESKDTMLKTSEEMTKEDNELRDDVHRTDEEVHKTEITVIASRTSEEETKVDTEIKHTTLGTEETSGVEDNKSVKKIQ